VPGELEASQGAQAGLKIPAEDMPADVQKRSNVFTARRNTLPDHNGLVLPGTLLGLGSRFRRLPSARPGYFEVSALFLAATRCSPFEAPRFVTCRSPSTGIVT
jgi:hypothetical protein